MNLRDLSSILLISLLSSSVVLQAKSIDLYKVLGVDKNVSQREIQKAFHRLSLKYHPDKNKSKGAQEKFAEINNGCTKQEAFLALVEGMVGAAAGKTVASQWTAETGCENESLAPSKESE